MLCWEIPGDGDDPGLRPALRSAVRISCRPLCRPRPGLSPRGLWLFYLLLSVFRLSIKANCPLNTEAGFAP